MEPHVFPDVRGGLLVGREAVADPFTTCVAFAEVAVANGVDIALNTELISVQPAASASHDGASTSPTIHMSELCLRVTPAVDAVCPGNAGSGEVFVRASHVVNVAGLGSRRVADMYGGAHFDINPRRGQFLVYDKHAATLISRILLPIPTKKTKGMLLAPTIFGNVISGPSAEDLPLSRANDTGTTLEVLDQVRANGIAMCPDIATLPPIASYAGLRCNCEQGSYTIRHNDGMEGVTTVTGIRSTGLTASSALARHLVDGLATEQRLELTRNPNAIDSRAADRMPGWWGSVPPLKEDTAADGPTVTPPLGGEPARLRPHEMPGTVQAEPSYGNVVCSCECITEGEIVSALRSPLRPQTLDSVKRRTRAMTGRCQSFNCLVPVARILSRELQLPLHAVTKRGPGTELALDSLPPRDSSPNFTETAVSQSSSVPPERRHFKVVVVGAGPSGVGMVTGLTRGGVNADDILVVDRSQHVGGIPHKYGDGDGQGGGRTFVDWTGGQIVTGGEFAAGLRDELSSTGVHVWTGTHVKQLLLHHQPQQTTNG